ncbi:HlyD family efflux transporter periplasmic adaptor subunit [Elioraea sp.]|uniref:HlyD family efflux transporter periplasmic adaptor subunit n=1 Tax=Elioraea sp. TaxID=2185103 RepID=UPI003F719D6E
MLTRRFSRVLVGVGLLGAAGYAFAPHLSNRISTAAVVNSEVIRIIAPIDGVADDRLPGPGVMLAAGGSRPVVRRLVVEDRERHRLAHDLALVRAQIVEARHGLVQLDAQDAELARRGALYHEATREKLATEIAETRAGHAGALAAAAQARAELDHVLTLRAARHVAQVRVETAEAALRQAEAAAEVLVARLAGLHVEHRAALAGVHLRDGHNDVPYSVQQRDRVMLQRQVLTERLAEARARESALAAALAAEEAARLDRDRYDLALGHAAIVWERHATPGAPVKPGEVLLDLVRCDDLFVEVALPDTAFGALASGDPAHVRLRGGIELQGSIRSIRGAGARSRKTLLAAERPAEHGARLTVEVALPADASHLMAPEGEGGFCGIGRLAEVSFPADFNPFGAEVAARFGGITRALRDAAGWAVEVAARLGASARAETAGTR